MPFKNIFIYYFLYGTIVYTKKKYGEDLFYLLLTEKIPDLFQ